MDYTNRPEKEWLKVFPKFNPPRNVRVQAEIMLETSLVMDNISLRHWLGGGELVCIKRDQRLLPHNQDIDFIVFTEDLENKIDVLKDRLLSKGYDINVYKHGTRISVLKNEELVSIEGYSLKKGYRWMKQRRVPERFFEKYEGIYFNGHMYRCPCPSEEYLDWRYLNWREEYSGNSKKRNKYINKKKLMGR